MFYSNFNRRPFWLTLFFQSNSAWLGPRNISLKLHQSAKVMRSAHPDRFPSLAFSYHIDRAYVVSSNLWTKLGELFSYYTSDWQHLHKQDRHHIDSKIDTIAHQENLIQFVFNLKQQEEI